MSGAETGTGRRVEERDGEVGGVIDVRRGLLTMMMVCFARGGFVDGEARVETEVNVMFRL